MIHKSELFATAALVLLPGFVLADTTGTGTYDGRIPSTVAITNASNGNLAGTLGSFGTLTIGSGTLSTPPPLTLRLRSNVPYRLSAAVTAKTGMVNGPPSSETAVTGQAMKTGDIGFGLTAAIDKSGSAVVSGGLSPHRTDTIASGYNVASGWPTPADGHPGFSKTLYDINSGAQILSGSRISADGDNSSDDNFLTVTLGVAALPQYFTPGDFTGTVTLTLTAND
jgi:hypothetical protein